MEELLEKIDRNEESHKGENGRVGVIAGSPDYTGAPALVAEASMRTGCDLAKVLTSGEVRDVVASYSENLIVGSYGKGYFDQGSLEEARELEEWADAVALGPGLGDLDVAAVRDFVTGARTPLVVDADAIEPALDADLDEAVFTPHGGEKRFIEEKFGSVERFVKEKEVVTVVKGPEDRIYTPDNSFILEKGTAAMTVGGTGDVLSGLITSLVSQGLGGEEAARLGCWINGRAGERAEERYGCGLVATDLIQEISGILKD